MTETSKKMRLIAIIAAVVAVVSICTAMIIIRGSSDVPFECGYGFRWYISWGMYQQDGGWGERWHRWQLSETDREALIERGRYNYPSLTQWFQHWSQTITGINPAALVLFAINRLAILTLIVLGFLWLNNFAKKVNALCEGDGKKTAGAVKFLLLGIITFGIYNLLWLYMLGERLYDNAKRYNLSFKEGGGTILLWFVPGMFILVGPFISLYIIIKNTNALASRNNMEAAQPV